MRLPLPGPQDLLSVLERGTSTLEQLVAAGPRVLRLLTDAERLIGRAGELVESIDRTRAAADVVVERTDAVVARAETVVSRSVESVTAADALLESLVPLNQRLTTLLDSLEPSLTRLQPVLERLSETTAPSEVDAMIELIDHLPRLASRMETDIMPVLDSLNTVAPDLHDLLDVSRELNEMLGQIPGLGRIKRRVDEQQEADGRG
jgi:DNA repair ATPase RecN